MKGLYEYKPNKGFTLVELIVVILFYLLLFQR
ncbi:prepilin-type N-terminal cleavage/methylation domain-containing protein [Vibrio lentus]|nr:prepilin-type N-terminal cleavage/methylation domain-containing protein [Vibrio lentus]